MKAKILIIVLLSCCAVQAWIYHPAYFDVFDLEDAYIYPSGSAYPGRLAEYSYDRNNNWVYRTLDNSRDGTGQIPALVTDHTYYPNGHSVKFEVTSSTAAKDRTEYNHLANLPFNFNSYTAFAIFVPESVSNPTSWQMMYQWHQFSPNSPPMSLDFMPNGNYSVVLRNDDDSYEQVYTAPLPRGQWVKFLFQHKFALDGNGYVKLWVDDVFKLDYTGTVGWYSEEDDYLINTKFGIYRAGTNQACTIYFDEVRVGTQYSEVRIP
ncbi:MAG: heparin lyase I family protein [Sedimentisphaeraceae bacterium JB056]